MGVFYIRENMAERLKVNIRRSHNGCVFFVAGGDTVTTIHCKKRECLNNKCGLCVAGAVTISKKCDDYITAHSAKKTQCAILHRENGRLKSKYGKEVIT